MTKKKKDRKLSKHKPRWHTVFRISKENMEELLGICEGISKKDDTFTYKVRRKSRRPTVVVFSDDEKQAFRRGMWIKNKLASHAVEPNWFKLREVG